MSGKTLAHYWGQLDQTDKEYLLARLQRQRPELHMGLLPFVPADWVYVILYAYGTYYEAEEMTITQKLLNLLHDHQRSALPQYKDVDWKIEQIEEAFRVATKGQPLK